MKVEVLVSELEAFLTALEEHRKLFGNSIDSVLPDRAVQNQGELRKQSEHLSRSLGKLRPYLEGSFPEWNMHVQLTGSQWDMLEQAINPTQIAPIKGESLNAVIQRIQQILGEYEKLEPDDEIPPDPDKRLGSGGTSDKVMIGYLDFLHPYIKHGCPAFPRWILCAGGTRSI